MTVTQLIATGFRLAALRNPALYQTWVKISHKVGSLLPHSLLAGSLQRAGRLDLVLRCMEDDFSPVSPDAPDGDIFAFEYQSMLSELWVGTNYEIFRLLDERNLVSRCPQFGSLAHDLKLLRIPLEKYEIAQDKKLSEPLKMQKHPERGDGTDYYLYVKGDPQRAHIMPSGISQRGSVMWHVFDAPTHNSYWLERRALSERIIALWGM